MFRKLFHNLPLILAIIVVPFVLIHMLNTAKSVSIPDVEPPPVVVVVPPEAPAEPEVTPPVEPEPPPVIAKPPVLPQPVVRGGHYFSPSTINASYCAVCGGTYWQHNSPVRGVQQCYGPNCQQYRPQYSQRYNQQYRPQFRPFGGFFRR